MRNNDMRKSGLVIVLAIMFLLVFGNVAAYNNQCVKSGCHNKKAYDSKYCCIHEPTLGYYSSTSTYNQSSGNGYSKTSETNSKNRSSSYKSNSYKSDPYDVYDYDDPDDFADEWADEFGDGDFDDGWDDAWDYWEEEN